MPWSCAAADDLLNVGDGLRIDAGERLVEQDQERLADQAAGDLQPAFLAAGAAGRVVLAQLASGRIARAPRSVRSQRSARVSLRPRLRLHGQHFQDGQDVLLDGQLAEDADCSCDR